MSDDDADFQDAFENTPIEATMDLAQGIAETQVALNLFLNNRFELARAKMEPWAKRSMYHALGHSTVFFIKAMMTCDPVDVSRAVEECKDAVSVCASFRRASSGSFLSDQVSRLVAPLSRSASPARPPLRSNSDGPTDSEMHAELCYAECLLQRALLSFIQDESLSSFVKGALRIRQCYNSYRECQRLTESVEWKGRCSGLRGHFESGVRMGMGTFSLLIASLPSRVLRLLEFVGFSGEKGAGLRWLTEGAAIRDSLRAPLCSLVLLTWNLVAVYLFGTGHGDLKLCQRLLDPLLKSFPNGALILYFAGRLNVVNARVGEAIACFDLSIAAQSEWRQFHHLCFWELMFSEAYLRNWTEASGHAYRLYKENRWSRCTYAYMGAVFLLARRPENLDWEERERMATLFTAVPKLRQRIAGKSLPVEKFAAAKAGVYERRGALMLPHYELLYLWNGFRVLSGSEALLVPILAEVEAALAKARLFAPDGKGGRDDVCLCLLLKAACLQHLQSPFQAEECLREITAAEKVVSSEASWLIPNAWLDLAFLRWESGAAEEAKAALGNARGYKNYLLATRLHFRAHALGDRLAASTPLSPPKDSVLTVAT